LFCNVLGCRDQPRHPYEDYVSLLSDDDFPQADDEEAEVQCAIQSSLSDARLGMLSSFFFLLCGEMSPSTLRPPTDQCATTHPL